MTDIPGLVWIKLGAFAATLAAMDRLFSWMGRRGCIYWRGVGLDADRAQRPSQLPLPEPVNTDDDLTLARIVQRQGPGDWPTLVPDATCSRALDDLRRAKLPARIVCFYVIEGDGRLAGVVSTRRLLAAGPSTRVSEIMARDVVSLTPAHSMEAAVSTLLGRTLWAVPILDDGRRLVGVVDLHLVAAECRRWMGRIASSGR